MIFGVYTHACPDGVIFYVGKGPRSRANKLFARNIWHQRIINKHGAENIKVRFYVCKDEKHALEREQKLIAKYKKQGLVLANQSNGGPGRGHGYKQTKESKNKISSKLMNREMSQEWRDKIKKALTGKKLSDETRAKLSKAGKGRKLSPEHVARLKECFTGKPLLESTKEKIRQSVIKTIKEKKLKQLKEKQDAR